MRWRKRQLDLIKKGQIEKKSKQSIYKQLRSLTKKDSSFTLPSLDEFNVKYQFIEDSYEFYCVHELADLLNTPTKTIKKWFRDYKDILHPFQGKAVQLKNFRQFVKKYPGLIDENCQPNLLWFISIF